MSQFTPTSDLARKAIDTVRKALPLFIPAPPIVHRDPEGYHIDVPILYMDFAVDRVHFNAETNAPFPKGSPVSSKVPPKSEEVVERMKAILEESRVLEACEFRKPERAWVVPWHGRAS
ncbi:hypothetical protein [Pyrococcus abyssi]|uniref:Uncharacterized protein n=1 Tax=Pyrococcus abyssi (strain GE5 / Orsay) TaxID=272844 RepID=Q9V1E2_PYRAB|nr:hypothetical protein [Pyrococcus abyssi]CAB49407.1 Hypothetical protein PAB0324 [Pyrococcus abyssi GE5]CCE69869.1 TPA: hypothetical protein PAB0324 [Pyrococcus abyssi GE5]